MAIRATDQNSVVIANQVNPSIFTMAWMVRQGLFALEDMQQQGTIISPHFVQVLTNDFHLSVMANRIQVTPVADEERQSEIANRVMGRIVHTLPETPYNGAAINLHYAVHSPTPFQERNRHLLARDMVLSRFFQEPNARFGAYFSQDYLGCRLKLNLKPAKPTREFAETVGSDDEFLVLEFNFHKDLDPNNNASNEVERLLGNWNACRTLSREIAEAIDNA